MRISKLLRKSEGFTLIELMIVIAVFGMIMGGIMAVHSSQSRDYVAQQDIADMQANLRAGLDFMAREIRPAGYEFEAGIVDDVAGITISGSTDFRFTSDFDDSGVIGGAGEAVRFAITNDANNDGIADVGGLLQLGWDRNDNAGGGGLQPFLDGIEAVGFAYAFDQDGDEQLETDAAGNILWAYDSNADNRLDSHLDTNADGLIDNNDAVNGAALPGGAVDADTIRAVRIWLLARSTNVDNRFIEPAGTQYVVAERRVNGNDGFRRRVASTIVRLRNM